MSDALLDGFLTRLEDRTAKIVVVGQGYVGLSIAMRASGLGFRVVGYDTSPKRVHALRDARSFGPARIAAIGEATAEALAAHGLVADLVPERFVAESLVDAFPDGPGRVLLPQAADARDVLAEGLSARGWEVDVVEAYRTERVRPSPDALAAVRSAQVVTFTSSSTVTGFLDAVDRSDVPSIVACIGPVTADTARSLGLHVDMVAGTHTVDGLVDALVEARRATGGEAAPGGAPSPPSSERRGPIPALLRAAGPQPRRRP